MVPARKNNQKNVIREFELAILKTEGIVMTPRVMINAIRCYFRVHAVATVVYRANIYQNAVESGTEF